jgi:hypothetical protein
VPFSGYRESSFSPDTLAVLEAAFNAAWDAVVVSGVDCDRQATRTALADAIVYFASEGETDPKRLKELALAALPTLPIKGRRPKPTELFLGSASILRLESRAASINFSRGQPQFQEGANRGSTARHSSHESPVINLPQLLWREHNLEPPSACH